MRLLAAAVVVVVAAGTGCFYQGGYRDLHGPFEGRRVALGGCIDLAVDAVGDEVAASDVIAYAFGNRCGYRVRLDLASIRATDGHGLPLVPHDPRRELRPLALEPHVSGREEIEYRSATGAPWTGAICVDVGAVDASAPSSGPRRECFGEGAS